ncbi:transmembrane protein 25 isoform X1 [Apteryx mantelli]|uniref:Transmembrane protein 25 isoform X1 n=1 Tax=Apteryx mantelli TaxID=2696672 RepID=A0ABM4FMT6_9AVES
MGHCRGSPGAALARLLLLLCIPALCPAGLGPTIDGRVLAARALHEGESRAFTCRAPRPAATLAWYLDGRQQEPDSPAEHSAASTFTLTARRTDRQLTCALTDPASGDVANASVRLDVQCKLWVLSLMRAALVCVGLAKGSVAHGALASPSAVLTAVSARPVAPEILRADARYAEAEGPGLLVVLLALVQANPPAAVTWVGPDGRAVANASELLTLDAGSHPTLANHTVRLRLGAAAGSFSVSAANGLGVANASVPAPGLLDARLELPLLGVAVGGALALGALLGLGWLTACVACCRAKPEPEPGLPGPAPLPPRCSGCLQPEGVRLPRENQSLPPNLRLSDLAQEPRASPGDAGTGAKAEERAQPELEKTLVLSSLGFVRFPMTGYIYKVSSMSSDEIWL